MYEAAWLDYEEFLNLGGDKMPPSIWLELCRVPEERGDYKRALTEYERLAGAHPAERQGVYWHNFLPLESCSGDWIARTKPCDCTRQRHPRESRIWI